MKTCTACGEAKDVSGYGRNRSLPDGLSFYCLACNRERNRRWYRDSRQRQGKQVRDLSWVPKGFRWAGLSPICRLLLHAMLFLHAMLRDASRKGQRRLLRQVRPSRRQP